MKFPNLAKFLGDMATMNLYIEETLKELRDKNIWGIKIGWMSMQIMCSADYFFHTILNNNSSLKIIKVQFFIINIYNMGFTICEIKNMK